MARSSSYVLDPVTGEWSKSTSDSSSSNNSSDNSSSSSSSNSASSGSNLTSTTSDGSSSTGTVEKEYNDIEMNTLSGTLNFIVTEETIQLKAGDTVKLSGLGKYLSGDYYVKEITRQIGSNGYSHSATLIKTDFGNSLKVKAPVVVTKSDGKKPTSAEEVKVESPAQATETTTRNHTVKLGDCLWNLSKQYYGNGAQFTKIYEANKDKIKSNYIIYVGQVLVIP